jgi:unsaturated rhamnogalacturonyl hydrolase
MTEQTFKPIPEALPWSIRGAETLLQRHPSLTHRWHYESGVALLAVQRVWERTKDPRYFAYIQRNIDEFVDPAGNIRTYTLEEFNLDQINQGKVLFLLYSETEDDRYKKAAFLLYEQMKQHPRTDEGGYWHKKIYPNQMWLDGLYMADPFLAQFARDFGDDEIFNDIAHQIAIFDRSARDSETGLLYHAWDSARVQQWADPQTGCSPHFWGRAMGWFMMATPDILDYFPEEHPHREMIIQVFRKTAGAVVAVQDQISGVWYQILNQGDRPGNYLEASASCMFVYGLAKGVRRGYLDSSCLPAAQKGYQGIIDQFVEVAGHGWVNLNGIVSVGGLGGNPYRDGSFEYYISEPVVSNDYKGFGPFIMASLEIECAAEKKSSQA